MYPEDFGVESLGHVSSKHVQPERHRKIGFLGPHHSEIEQKLKTHILVGKLPFVYQKTCIHLSCEHLVHDLVKRRFNRDEIVRVETQKKIRGREFSGYRNGFSPEV